MLPVLSLLLLVLPARLRELLLPQALLPRALLPQALLVLPDLALMALEPFPLAPLQASLALLLLTLHQALPPVQLRFRAAHQQLVPPRPSQPSPPLMVPLGCRLRVLPPPQQLSWAEQTLPARHSPPLLGLLQATQPQPQPGLRLPGLSRLSARHLPAPILQAEPGSCSLHFLQASVRKLHPWTLPHLHPWPLRLRRRLAFFCPCHLVVVSLLTGHHWPLFLLLSSQVQAWIHQRV
mmetsp:Transcript_8535/g.15598  ORF Transcript_8535/g.15598 Transcript_8535/m.15598 type:complete len:236 (-) Transcript_8535:264-971(-)